MEEEHWSRARAQWERETRVEAQRARVAMGALGATVALRIVRIGLFAIGARDFAILEQLDLALLLLTAVVFLRWLARAVSVASAMSAVRLAWTSSAAVWAFFMPIVGLWRPYRVLRDLHDLVAPDGVPEPAPRPVLDGSGGYRHVAMQAAPPPRPVLHASIGAWWGLFVLTRLLGYGNERPREVIALGDGLGIVSAILAILMVRAVDGRIQERYRRLRHASDDELATWHLRA